VKLFGAGFKDWGCLLPTDHQPEMPPANGEHNWIQQLKKVRGTLHEVLIVVAKWVKTDCRELLDWGCFFATKAPTSNDTDKWRSQSHSAG